EDAALKAQTIQPAKMLHLDDRVGSLEKGKDADFVVLSGSPYSIYTHVLETYIEGVQVFDRAKHKDWTYQAGGFAVADPNRVPKTPPDLKTLPAAKTPEIPKSAPAFKDSPAHYAIRAGRIHTVGKGTIIDGVVLVKD